MVMGVIQHEDHGRHRSIADLERESSLQGLKITDASLGLDADRPDTSRDRRIPRTKVHGSAWNGLDDGHLWPPSQRWGEPRPEAPEQRDMACVAERVAVREASRAQIEAHERKELGDPRH